MKKIAKATILIGLISIMISSTVLANTSDGWTYIGNPKYAKKNSEVYIKGDIAGTNVMDRIRDSYSYRNRTDKIKNSNQMQTEFLIKDNTGNNIKNYTNMTYDNTPSGEIGYTGWYDSPYGLFFDYESPFASGKPNGIDTAPPKSIQQDNIDFNNIQFPNNSGNAYIATLDADGGLADAKVASYLGRDSEKYYPIYLNNGSSINSNVTSELKRKGTKNLFVLGGSRRFELTAGLTGDFNVIRIGGVDRNETKEYMLNSPKKMTEPNRYPGNNEGIVMKGVPDELKGTIREFLLKEKVSRDGSGIIKSSEYIIKKLPRDEIGSKTNKDSEPVMILGVNDGVYEAYWICYYKGKQGEYVYQYVLGNYFPPVPQSGLKVTKSDYKESDSVHWVKPNSQFSVYTEGSVSNVRKDYPQIAELWLHNPKFGNLNNWESAKSQMSTYHQSNSGQFNDDFNKIKDERAWTWSDGGRNCLSANHYITAKYDNQDYNLLSTVHYNNDWINPINSGVWIKTDGTSPTISGIPSSNWTKNDVDINIRAIDSRSGIKSVELYKGSTKVSSGVGSLSYIEKIDGIHGYKVVATDNVGNIKEQTFTIKIDRLEIKGIITPNPAPAGKKLNMDINTRGRAKRIKIEFPGDLVKLSTTEDPLIFNKSITIEDNHTEKVEAWLPLETPVTLDRNNKRVRPAYSIYIEAENEYGVIKSGYMSLDVKGSIYDNLRYGIKASGYDRKKQ